MLDLDDPHSQYIFAASRGEDQLLRHAQRMTLVPSPERERLLLECLYVLDDLRHLNRDHFKGKVFIADALDEIETALTRIATLGDGNVTEDRSDGGSDCAVCGTPITRFKPFPTATEWIICCDHCLQSFSPARAKLASLSGFATDAI